MASVKVQKGMGMVTTIRRRLNRLRLVSRRGGLLLQEVAVFVNDCAHALVWTDSALDTAVVLPPQLCSQVERAGETGKCFYACADG